MRSLAALWFAALACAWSVAGGASLDKISNQDAVGGLKAALEKGAGVAVDALGKIRQDPVKAGSDIIRKVFGALK